jgi:hypothetical protein
MKAKTKNHCFKAILYLSLMHTDCRCMKGIDFGTLWQAMSLLGRVRCLRVLSKKTIHRWCPGELLIGYDRSWFVAEKSCQLRDGIFEGNSLVESICNPF